SVTTTFQTVYEADPNLGNNVSTRTTSVKSGTCVEPTATPTPTTRIIIIVGSGAPTPPPATPTVAATDLSLSQTSSGVFAVGATPSYTFRVINVGRVATNSPTTLVDSLPRGLSFVSASGNGWSCSVAGQQVTCAHEASLQAGEASDLSLKVSIGTGAYPAV